jgi:hypothetical protein
MMDDYDERLDGWVQGAVTGIFGKPGRLKRHLSGGLDGEEGMGKESQPVITIRIDTVEWESNGQTYFQTL